MRRIQFNFNNESNILELEQNTETNEVTLRIGEDEQTFDSIEQFAEYYAVARNVKTDNLKNWVLLEEGDIYSYVLQVGTAGVDYAVEDTPRYQDYRENRYESTRILELIEEEIKEAKTPILLLRFCATLENMDELGTDVKYRLLRDLQSRYTADEVEALFQEFDNDLHRTHKVLDENNNRLYDKEIIAMIIRQGVLESLDESILGKLKLTWTATSRNGQNFPYIRIGQMHAKKEVLFIDRGMLDTLQTDEDVRFIVHKDVTTIVRFNDEYVDRYVVAQTHDDEINTLEEMGAHEPVSPYQSIINSVNSLIRDIEDYGIDTITGQVAAFDLRDILETAIGNVELDPYTEVLKDNVDVTNPVGYNMLSVREFVETLQQVGVEVVDPTEQDEETDEE